MPTPIQTAQPLSFIIDPARDGIANALWYANSGTLALSGSTPEKFRFNTDDAIARVDLLFAVVEFAITFPTTGVQTPTNLANNIAFGLKNASMGLLGKIDVLISQSGNSIVFRTYDEFGTVESTTLTWNTAWNSALTLFRFGWAKDHVSIEVLPAAATAWVALANHSTRVPSRPLNPFFNVVGNDNVDVSFIAIKPAQGNSIMLI